MTENESIFLYSLDKIKAKIKIDSGDFMETTGKGTIVIDTKRIRDTSMKFFRSLQMIEKGIFLSYRSQLKGYQFYNLITKKLFFNRDIKFDEGHAYK